MNRYILSGAAQREMEEIWFHIAQDNIEFADQVIDAIVSRCRQLAEFPYAGRLREEFGVGIRSASVGSYIILYRPRADGVEVGHIIHGARDIPSILDA